MEIDARGSEKSLSFCYLKIDNIFCVSRLTREGSGGMFVQSVKFVEAHHGNKKDISIVGQESKPDTWRLCKMNLAIRGISHNLGDKNASTFTEDLHKDRKVDFIMANPPFNLSAPQLERLNGGFAMMKSDFNVLWMSLKNVSAW